MTAELITAASHNLPQDTMPATAVHTPDSVIPAGASTTWESFLRDHNLQPTEADLEALGLLVDAMYTVLRERRGKPTSLAMEQLAADANTLATAYITIHPPFICDTDTYNQFAPDPNEPAFDINAIYR